MKRRGRPIGSVIRQNIVEILYFKKRATGYDIYQIYKRIFPRCTMRVIYYHLKKGLTTGEFTVDRIVREKGNYSWGTTAEKTYYALGDSASPRGSERVRKAI